MLLTLLWVVLGPVALAILVRVLNPVIYRRSYGGRVNYARMDKSPDSSHATICLPGILALGSVQFAPLRSVLGRFGNIWAVSYASRIFKGDVVALLVAQRVARTMRRGTSVTILGSSLGANLAIQVVDNLRVILGDEAVERAVTVQLHDAPLGGQTMKGLPEFFRKILIALPASPIPNFIGNLALKLMKVPPKDKNIEAPTDTVQLAGSQMSVDDFNAWVKATAIEGLSGHRFSMWWSQLSWMCRVENTLPFQAMRNVSVVYLRCNGDRNDTIHQPAAGDQWMLRVPHMMIIEVDSTHCGYLERYLRWVDAIQEAFRLLGVPPRF